MSLIKETIGFLGEKIGLLGENKGNSKDNIYAIIDTKPTIDTILNLSNIDKHDKEYCLEMLDMYPERKASLEKFAEKVGSYQVGLFLSGLPSLDKLLENNQDRREQILDILSLGGKNIDIICEFGFLGLQQFIKNNETNRAGICTNIVRIANTAGENADLALRGLISFRPYIEQNGYIWPGIGYDLAQIKNNIGQQAQLFFRSTLPFLTRQAQSNENIRNDIIKYAKSLSKKDAVILDNIPTLIETIQKHGPTISVLQILPILLEQSNNRKFLQHIDTIAKITTTNLYTAIVTPASHISSDSTIESIELIHILHKLNLGSAYDFGYISDFFSINYNEVNMGNIHKNIDAIKKMIQQSPQKNNEDVLYQIDQKLENISMRYTLGSTISTNILSMFQSDISVLAYPYIKAHIHTIIAQHMTDELGVSVDIAYTYDKEFLQLYSFYYTTQSNKKQTKDLLIKHIQGQTYTDDSQSPLTTYPLYAYKNMEWIQNIFDMNNERKNKEHIRYNTNTTTYILRKTNDIDNEEQLRNAYITVRDGLNKIGISNAHIPKEPKDLVTYFYKRIASNSELYDNDIYNHLFTEITTISHIINGGIIDDKTIKVTLKHEQNPIKQAMLGNIIAGSCLDLDSTSGHAGSAITTALDANKSVIYIYNESGDVLGRVQIAIDNTGKIHRFPLHYTKNIGINLEGITNQYLKKISSLVGLSFDGDINKVSTLVGDNRYTDANEITDK